jgi:outer membrane protein assembly factor BamA
LGGSEQLTIKVSGSLEAFLQEQNSKMLGRYSYEVGSSAELRFPRFLFFNQSLFSARYTPSNHIRLEARLTDQVQYYRMSFMNAAYGFRWTETNTKRHEFNLINMSYQHTLQRTSIYDSLLNINPLLKQSFADQFIFGSNYSYQYALPERDKRVFRTAFTGTLDVSGNLLYGLQRAFGVKKENGEPIKFLGAVYSQYVRTTVDYRMYLKLFPADELATRFNVGVGIPLGNSSTLPAIKQFYLGGANTIRAFPFRSVGPGAYSTAASGYAVLINHTGEIELLGSIENRLRFAKRLELALFIDAGNIWVVKNDPQRENAQFNSSLFYKQLAVGWGYGLRYLNDFFILRVDVGYPVSSPNTLEKISDMKPVLNFAIGYPF